MKIVNANTCGGGGLRTAWAFFMFSAESAGMIAVVQKNPHSTSP